MRSLKIVLSAAAAMTFAASAADARPSFAGARAGGSATAEKPAEKPTLLEAVTALLQFKASAKAVAGSEAPRASAPRTEQCEEDKQRAASAKAAETRRTAEMEKSKARGGEPVYLAF